MLVIATKLGSLGGEARRQDRSVRPLQRLRGLDGNGRVGRLLIILFLIERDILPAPLLYLSAFFEATRQEYYDKLNDVRTRASWVPWLEYFLNGVARMSEDCLSRTSRINGLLAKWRQQAAGTPSRLPVQVIDLLAENPYWTVAKIAERAGVAFTTAQRAIDRLLALKVVAPVSDAKRGRVYVAQDIMSILDEPARTRPSLPKGSWRWTPRGLGLPAGTAQALLDETRAEREGD